MEVTGPFTLALGQETAVNPPNGGIRFTRVVLANASPFACQVNSGGVAQWLQPWTSDVYPCADGNPAQVTPALTTAGGAASNQLTATWLLDTDKLTGTYPAAIPPQLALATITGTPTVAISGTPTIQFAAGQSVDINSVATNVSVVNPTGNNTISLNATPALGPADYGSGKDGAVVISVNTTLTRDMNYSSLTVNAGVTLTTAGFIVRSTGTVTDNGTIDNSATANTPGAGGSLGPGASGLTTSGPGLAPTSATIQGGAGGFGNNSTTNANGGTTGLLPISLATIFNSGTTLAGGASGGMENVNTSPASGAGGGCIAIFAPTITGTGTISANGGNGTAGSGANKAGSGGGGGGVIVLACQTLGAGLTIVANGGTGVTVGVGSSAGAGAGGRILEYVV